MVTTEGGMDSPHAMLSLTANLPYNITHVITEHARRTPDAPAIIAEDVTLDYAALDRAVRRCAWDLQTWGVAHGDRVTLFFSDEVLLAISLLAVGRLGATTIAIPRSSTPAQYQEWVTQAGSNRCVTDLAGLIVPNSLSLQLDRRWLTQALTAKSDVQPVADLEMTPLAPLMIVVGSGSTGRPKLIPITHAQMQHRVATLNLVYEVTPQDRLAIMTHLEYASGVHRLFSALVIGAAFVLPDRSALVLANLQKRFGVTLLSATVFHLEQMLRALPHIAKRPLDGITITASGSIVSDRLRRDVLDHLCADLRIVYGANETWTATIARSPGLLCHNGTVGQVVPGVQVEIVDNAMRPVATGSVGLIRIRSPSVVDGYLDDKTENARAFQDGWFVTSDLGWMTEDGHLIFCGRADDMMISNGINIYPIEIEQCLLSHPSVIDAVALPIHHPIHQDIPVALVVLTGLDAANEKTLLTYAKERIGARRPRSVIILDRIPRNERGKPIRSELRRLAEEAISKTIQTSNSPLAAAPATTLTAGPPAQAPLRQLTRRINLDFKPPTVLQPRAIDAWWAILNPHLAIPVASPFSPAASAQEHAIAEWLDRALLLVRELLQLAAIPVFDTLALVACQSPTTPSASWRAVISVPQVDHVPARAYEIAFGSAARATAWMMTQAPTAASREILFAKLMQDAIEPLKKLASGGKSTMPLLQAAHSRGIPFRSLGGGIYQLGLGAKGRLTDRSTNDRDSAIGTKLAQSKPLSAQVLRLAGLPAPAHQVVTSATDALAAAERLGWPVVVKPTDRDRGEGVSVDINATNLNTAFAEAQRLSRTKQVIVERQAEGVCHRLFLASGRLLYAVKRLPMGVYGDGRRSIEALVSGELAVQALLPPWRRSELRPIDDLARAAILAEGLLESSVPAVGQFVPLRRIESTAWGGIDEEVTDQVHPENLRVALATAQLLGLDVAGIDIISPDISEPWHANGAIINEVNFAPLLGGGETSRRHIGEYLTRLLEGDGRIPLEVFLGGDAAWHAAMARRNALGGDDAGIYVTSARRTLDGNGHEIRIPFQTLHERSRAMLLSRQVRTLLLVVQDDEWLRTGLPVEYLDSIVDAGGALRQHQNPDLSLSKEQERALRQLLAERVRTTAA